jgi:hypothetical protein
MAHYLVGRKVYVSTDNVSVACLQNLHLKTNHECRISAYLAQFDLNLTYKEGSKNGKADFFSRMYEDIPKSERVKFYAEPDDDDRIFAIQRRSEKVRGQNNQTQARTKIKNEAGRAESIQTTNTNTNNTANRDNWPSTNCPNDILDNKTEDDTKVSDTTPTAIKQLNCIDAALGPNTPHHTQHRRPPPCAGVVIDISSVNESMGDNEIQDGGQHGRQRGEIESDFSNKYFNAGNSTFPTVNSFNSLSLSERENSMFFKAEESRKNEAAGAEATPTTD